MDSFVGWKFALFHTAFLLYVCSRLSNIPRLSSLRKHVNVSVKISTEHKLRFRLGHELNDFDLLLIISDYNNGNENEIFW